jgi:hypothetical protein
MNTTSENQAATNQDHVLPHRVIRCGIFLSRSLPAARPGRSHAEGHRRQPLGDRQHRQLAESRCLRPRLLRQLMAALSRRRRGRVVPGQPLTRAVIDMVCTLG